MRDDMNIVFGRILVPKEPESEKESELGVTIPKRDEAHDRFCTFMCNNYDHYSETRNRKIDGLFGSIMDDSRCVGGYDIYRIED